MSEQSRAEYQRRMHRVMAYIDRHLDETLELDDLAAIACFSPFHFHRLFSAWVGETAGEYIRRRRLEQAAIRLHTQPHLNVLELALAVGFGSSEAFARAFKLRFGYSPSAWRRRKHWKSNPDQDADTADTHTEGLPQTTPECVMTINLIEREAQQVMYLRYVGPHGMPLNKFWMETVFPWIARHGLQGQPFYGISHDNPEITPPEKCRYDCCVEIPAGFAVPAAEMTATIPGGRYAALSFRGTVPEVGAAWTHLLRDWLPGSGYQFDARPCFEHYPVGSSYDPATGIFTCEICIPVRPL